ncbi:MAG: HAMP domain-containing sensor histidine kinase [Polyangia bacterium]
MSGAPPIEPLVRRILITAATYAIVTCIAMPLVLEQMLALATEQTRWLQLIYVSASLLLLATLAAGLNIGLRGVAGAAPYDERARRRVLRMPVRLAILVVAVGASFDVITASLRVWASNDPAALLIGIGLTGLALIGALAVPAFIAARAALEPHALYFASATLPAGRRLRIGTMVGYTILSIAALALVPSALLGNARLAHHREAAVHERCRATAHRLAVVANATPHLDPLRFVAQQRLGHATVLLRLPSGVVVPDDPASHVGPDTGEAPLSGALSGGAILVVPQPMAASWAPLLILVLLLESLVALVALSLRRALARDIGAVTSQVEALADDREPPAAPTMTSTEIRRVALALNRLLERLPRLQLEKYLAVEQADESRRLKSMFLANMSHDLRSPLNSILGFSELLTRGLEGPITTAQRALLDDIHGAGSHLLRLLSEILETARAESGHLDLDRKPVPPTTLVTQARKEALRGRSERIGELLEIVLQPGMAPAHVDALRMQQALTHALDWAIEVAHGARIRIELSDRDRPMGRALVVEVWCDGRTSIEEEAQLFQPFRKVEGVPGLHLALPLARRIVEAHGGVMEAYGGQRPGVRIILPRGSGNRSAANVAAAERGRG